VGFRLAAFALSLAMITYLLLKNAPAPCDDTPQPEAGLGMLRITEGR